MQDSNLEFNEQKSKLRSQVLALRKIQSSESRQYQSQNVCNQIIQFLENDFIPSQKNRSIDNPITIAAYSAMPDELSLDHVIDHVKDFPALQVVYPRILSFANAEMDFAIPLTEHDWIKDAKGIRQPKFELQSIDLTCIDLIVVPGVAFTKEGARLGMGMGFYDRMLPKMPQALRIAGAFDFQLVDQIVEGPYDQRVDLVFSPKT